MESRTKNRKTRAELERMAFRAFGEGFAPGSGSLVELKEGWFNVAYDATLSSGRRAVLKIAPPEGVAVMSYEKRIMETEVASMRLVGERTAVPAPEVYFYDASRELCDSSYFFMERIEGESYERVRASLPEAVRDSIDFEIGRCVRAINGFEGSFFGYPGNPALQAASWREAFLKIVEAALADGRRGGAVFGFDEEAIREAVLKHAPALDAVKVPRLVHWDAWDSNVFVKDGAMTGLLDFERSLWGDPLMEAQFRTFGDEELGVTESLRGYGKTGFSFDEERRLRLYTLYLGLVMNAECRFRLYEDDSIYELSLTLLKPSMKWLRAN